MIKIGVLGAGFMGGTHARAFAKIPGVQVAGVTSRSAEKAAALAEEVGGAAFTDPMKLVNDPDIDAISNTLPTHLHEEFTIAALKAGKDVLLEKPMALTVEACDQMMAAAEKSGKIFMLAHVLRFWPEYTALIDFVNRGQLGKPLSATASRLSTRPAWGDWFTNSEWTGGAVHDLQVHDLDVLNWLFGAPKSVYARGQKGAPGGWDHILTLVDYGGSEGFAEGSVMMPEGYPFTMTLWVLCEKGSVEFTFRAGGTGVESGDEGSASLMVYESGKDAVQLSVPESDAYEIQADYFVSCLRDGKQPLISTPEQGRLAVKTALAARQSLDTGHVVFLTE